MTLRRSLFICLAIWAVVGSAVCSHMTAKKVTDQMIDAGAE